MSQTKKETYPMRDGGKRTIRTREGTLPSGHSYSARREKVVGSPNAGVEKRIVAGDEKNQLARTKADYGKISTRTRSGTTPSGKKYRFSSTQRQHSDGSTEKEKYSSVKRSDKSELRTKGTRKGVVTRNKVGTTPGGRAYQVTDSGGKRSTYVDKTSEGSGIRGHVKSGGEKSTYFFRESKNGLRRPVQRKISKSFTKPVK